MRRGRQLERPVIETYQRTMYPQARVTYPSIVQHPTIEYMACSPDGMLGQINTRACVLLEVKTGVSEPPKSKYVDQVQFNLLVTGCDRATVLFYCTAQDDESTTVIFSKIKVYDIDVDMVWRAKFMKHAQTFYDLYLKWLYCNPIDRTSGIAVASSLLA